MASTCITVQRYLQYRQQNLTKNIEVQTKQPCLLPTCKYLSRYIKQSICLGVKKAP